MSKTLLRSIKNKTPPPLAQVKGKFMEVIQNLWSEQAISPARKNRKWSTVCHLEIKAESLTLLPCNILFGAIRSAISASPCRSTRSHMADAAIVYALPIPFPSSLRGPQFDEAGLSQLWQSVIHSSCLPYTEQWPCICFWQMRLKKKNSANSRKALALPDKKERCFLGAHLPFSSFSCDSQSCSSHCGTVIFLMAKRIPMRSLTLGRHWAP